MLSTPTCYRWDGVEVPYAYLQRIYQFAIHDGTDHIPAGATQAQVEAVIDGLNADPAVTGFIVQQPTGLDEFALLSRVAPEKDVDGLHPYNLGCLVIGRPAPLPCTPIGCVELLRRYDVPIAGAHVVVVGRGLTVEETIEQTKQTCEGVKSCQAILELGKANGVEMPITEQVVQVGDAIFVKVIDIDLERRRISLSLKQANDAAVSTSEFDPTLYGMAAEYDEQGNYKYPEGFDPETNEWLEGYETQREKWEKQYADAHARWEAHKTQVEAAIKADAEAAVQAGDVPSSYSSGTTDGGASIAEGTLASDEALAALREKLTGN